MSIDQPDKHRPVYRIVQEKQTNSKFSYSGKTYILKPSALKSIAVPRARLHRTFPSVIKTYKLKSAKPFLKTKSGLESIHLEDPIKTFSTCQMQMPKGRTQELKNYSQAPSLSLNSRPNLSLHFTNSTLHRKKL